MDAWELRGCNNVFGIAESFSESLKDVERMIGKTVRVKKMILTKSGWARRDSGTELFFEKNFHEKKRIIKEPPEGFRNGTFFWKKTSMKKNES